MAVDDENKNKIYITPFLFILNGAFLLLLFYFLTRIIFYTYNKYQFLNQDLYSIGYAFLHGVRFDAASIALMNAPLVLSLFILVWFKNWHRFTLNFTFAYFAIVNSLSLIVNLIDTVYFPFVGRRSGLEVLSMMRDVSMQGPQILLDYWWFCSIGVTILLFFIAALISIKNRVPSIEKGVGTYFFVCGLIVVSFVFSARGGLQAKPIRSLHAYAWPNSELGSLVLNTPFTLMRESTTNIKRMTFFQSESVAHKVVEPVHQSADLVEKDASDSQLALKEMPPQNVVVILLESFSLEYFGEPYGKTNYVPFLTTLTEKGRFYPNGIANGRRSIEAIPSVFSGIPSLMSEAFMRSPFQSNKVYGIGEILKAHGYQTAFFHGAKNGSMYFDDTTYRLGFDEYYGLDEYPNSDDYDGQWGIFDEPFLQFTAGKIDELEPPFLAGVFTISSHPPYTLPAEYENVMTNGVTPMHNVVQYSDLALRRFFEAASQKEWFNNTLFVITADHTSDNFDKRFGTPMGRHQIPILLYHPNGMIKPETVQEVAQQVDIPATIIDYLKLPEKDKLMPFGRSLLQPAPFGEAIIREGGAYWLILDDQYMKLTFDGLPVYDMGKLPETFHIKSKSDNPQPERLLRERINAYVQLYINGLIDNNHYPNLAKETQ
ncbi:LTA synthase family protein [Marinomonas algicola]|uniref:LTA synthase family protein n=1 Tax=Marinomonas algicola TaxID=2773454 RepID=UPI00174918D8|nr:LTA synthase family protein [Marinomonas algicola]